MNRPIVLLAALLLWTIGAGVCSTSLRAEADATRESAFDTGLRGVQHHLDRRHWRAGLERLKRLLDEHGDVPYVRERRVGIEDLARRLAFGYEQPPPEPRGVVSGKLESYVKSLGRIRIRYTPETSDDLQRIDGGLVAFPARFTGPFTIRIEGKAYPLSAATGIRVMVGGDEDPRTGQRQLWQFICGIAPAQRGGRDGTPAVVVHMDGEQARQVWRREVYPAKAGAPYTITVRATQTSINLSLNGMASGQARKPRDVYGGVAFSAPGWTEVSLEGVVEPSWIQGLLDEAVQEKRSAFDVTHDPSRYLPAWLLRASRLPEGPTAPSPTAARYPGGVTAEQARSLDEVATRIARGNLPAASRRLDQLSSEGVPEAALTYVAARGWLLANEMPKALEVVRRSRELASDFLPAALLEAEILSQAGRTDDARRAYGSALKEHPDTEAGYVAAAVFELREGRLPAARDVSREAVKRGVVSERLEALSRALVKAERGPTWRKVYSYQSANYHILSDIDRSTCQDAAKILEEALRAYQAGIRYLPGDGVRRFKVYLFRGRAGFLQYLKDLGVLGGGETPIMVAGAYNPLLKQLLIWNLPSRDQMLETVRHEGFHQYLDRFLGNPPVWFNEGLAEYYQSGLRPTASPALDGTSRGHIEVLTAGPREPLEKFLFHGPRAFHGGGQASYAQAWALVHMLRHGSALQQRLFRRLLDDLQTMPAHEALLRNFDEQTIAALQKALDAYVKRLAAR